MRGRLDTGNGWCWALASCYGGVWADIGDDLSLSALPLALLVPPLNLVPVCFAGLAIARWRPRIGFAVVALGLSGLLLLASPMVARRLVTSLEHGLPLTPPDGQPPTAIVILSGDAMRSAGVALLTPGPQTLERERVGAALARRTGLPILVAGGPIGSGPDSFAAVMARSMAEDFGTPVRWSETDSADTWENARNSAAILRAAHIQSVYLVTHAWHMRRALIAFAPTGITVTAAPVRLDPDPPVQLGALLPVTGAWMASFLALHEWIGCAEYAWLR